jgi:hypothetical protein
MIQFFSCRYTLLIFDGIKEPSGDISYKKTFRSINQVYFYSKPFDSINNNIKTKRYGKNYFNGFYRMVQYTSMLNHPDLKKAFLRPKKPFLYFAL